MKPIQELFPIYNAELPESWVWATVHFVFGEGRTGHFTEYGITEDRGEVKTDFSNKVGDVEPLFHELRDMIAPPPMEQPTHIELTIQSDGVFDTVLGYGEPNWDPAPRGWPDDITADEYTYTKAWPNGINEKTKKLFKDPRSRIGYD